MDLQILFPELKQKFGRYVTIDYILSNAIFYSTVSKYLKSHSLDEIKVLNVGSSYGYGIYIMSKLCPNWAFTGIDINKTAISVATDILRSDNINFEIVNMVDKKQVSQFIKKYGQFDAITCFEVFEHIPPSKSQIFLENLNLLLKDSGYLFISTPNQIVYDVFAFTEDH